MDDTIENHNEINKLSIEEVRSLIKPRLTFFKARKTQQQKKGFASRPRTYPDITKPAIMEFLYTNDKIYLESMEEIEMCKALLEWSLENERLEDNPKRKIKLRKKIRKFAAIFQLTLWDAERYLYKFEKENFLSKVVIEQHRKEILELKQILFPIIVNKDEKS